MSKKRCDQKTQALIEKIAKNQKRLSNLSDSQQSESSLADLRNKFYIESSVALLEALLVEYDKQQQCLLNQIALYKALDKVKSTTGGEIPF